MFHLTGLPAFHYPYVRNVVPNLPLFLFNYDDRKLHGIYEAASHGVMNIDPYAWTDDGARRTPFPAQVMFLNFHFALSIDFFCFFKSLL